MLAIAPSYYPGRLRTVKLNARLCQGKGIVLFRERDALVGYALLAPYWSNEFGGTLLFVDEMFVVPEARRRGIGERFFSFIEKRWPFEAVALALSQSPQRWRPSAL